MSSMKWKLRLKRLLGMELSIREEAYFLLKPHYNVIDAGAHAGWDTKFLASITHGNVYAFEPVPTLYEELIENTNGLQNVVHLPLAVSTHSGNVEMFVSGGASDGSSSLLPPKEHLETNPDVTFGHSIMVQAVTFDQWMKSSGVEKVEFLWLDLQGMELSVLQASPMLMRDVQVIYTEVATRELYTGQAMYQELKSWLELQGFILKKENLAYEFAGDALFVRG